jgi:hypothetical protein
VGASAVLTGDFASIKLFICWLLTGLLSKLKTAAALEPQRFLMSGQVILDAAVFAMF